MLSIAPNLLTTQRLLLRQWRDSDRDAFARLNEDPLVMEYFPRCLPRDESEAWVSRTQVAMAERGWGLWAVEVRGVVPFIGFVGLSVPMFTAHFTPCVEIGWRIAKEFWGHGYATEAAIASLHFGFEKLRLQQIVSFTASLNERSIGVMQRIGMTHNCADDFDHPSLPAGHRLQRHVLYRMQRSDWERL
ncbi:MAG: GNAT family N-acetyltransferase [Proteobacteria bacterium]|nr:GNAT family N-acetyltransferase [Pseudomonadota bacterium]